MSLRPIFLAFPHVEQHAIPAIPFIEPPRPQFEERDDFDDGYWWSTKPLRTAYKPTRNEPCPCGSGVKFKRCCGGRGDVCWIGPSPRVVAIQPAVTIASPPPSPERIVEHFGPWGNVYYVLD